MEQNINYYPHDIVFCIKCRSIFYITNYSKHLKTKKHLLNKSKINKYKYGQKNIINFD